MKFLDGSGSCPGELNWLSHQLQLHVMPRRPQFGFGSGKRTQLRFQLRLQIFATGQYFARLQWRLQISKIYQYRLRLRENSPVPAPQQPRSVANWPEQLLRAYPPPGTVNPTYDPAEGRRREGGRQK